MEVASGWDADLAQAIIEARKALPGATLPILHALQDHFGYVDRAAVPAIAAALNLSKAEVHGVVSFYHEFRTSPPGRHVLKLCRAEACQANGCESLVRHLATRHGIKPGAPSPSLSVETVYCLGNCALGPAALLDGVPLGRLSASDLDALISQAV